MLDLGFDGLAGLCEVSVAGFLGYDVLALEALLALLTRKGFSCWLFRL